ncbi:EAL domain-containing protein [Sphingomonas sp. AR_OL41]|uniref:putative bifunctional diguanylate cyclase/phosphodiesterase n=1 Tax=Sphingomonas sp. AR_OL41 TaxID=3042729 RepID=UPI002481844A|nr:EAL domain-containing protein [Sphingomonas sp. AR_OL41]MDH7973332.1 EAL domain-containing protein [Sphingomonas sp. AR_OL41]
MVKRVEGITILVAGLLLGLIFVRVNAFDAFELFVARHEDWQLDEVFAVAFFGGFAALILVYRRARELRAEIVRREAAEEHATLLARHDPLTGLPNRRLLNAELGTAIDGVRSIGGECAVFLIDLDQFKPVNDMHGHNVGDAVLIEVAARLTALCEPGSTIARLGGDEFVCVIRHAAGSDMPARTAGQIVRSLSEPIHVGDVALRIGATVGIARCPYDATTVDALLRAADVAMYEAKRAGRGRYHFFDAEMDVRLRERASLESELRAAIAHGEISAHYQPVISLSDNRIIGFEALARWDHPVRGLLSPDLFIPIAEDIGLIGPLSYDMLRSGCIAARDWPPYATLSINISPLQLKDPWLAGRLLAILAETGFAPSRLIVEITESAIIDDIALVAEVFTSLQNAGIRIALDDFGKGYASLNHLRQLHFDQLKIDSAFVLSMDAAESLKIVSAISGLGKALGMPVTAEGVETMAAADALRALGCERAQGFLFGRPLSAGQTRALFDPAAVSVMARTGT